MEIKGEARAPVGAIICRIHVDELHDAHIDLIDTVRSRHDKTILILGLGPIKCSIENPLDFESRKLMVLERYPDITVLYLKDVKENEDRSEKLDDLIDGATSESQKVDLYGGRDSFIKYYSGEYHCIELVQTSFTSGTAIRKKIYSNSNVKADLKWRRGVIWATGNQEIYPRPAVHCAIFNIEESGETKLLLARMKGESKYSLIWGYVEVGESYEKAVTRIVNKMTGLTVAEIKYSTSQEFDDWKYRSEKVKVTTILFTSKKIVEGSPEPGKGVDELRWFESFTQVDPDELIVPEHIQLFTAAI